MSTATTHSEWADLWQSWGRYEREWNEKNSGALVRALVTGAPAKHLHVLQQWRQNKNVAQPQEQEIADLIALGDRLRSLQTVTGPLPDVYAAACQMKLANFCVPPAPKERLHGFRGTNNDQYPLRPSVQRPLPGMEEPTEELLKERHHQLALFCEAMRQILQSNGLPSDEQRCMAIAQHYGVKSPLVDLTWSPWVALFFASHRGKPGDIGIVQIFSMSALRDLLGRGDTGFGALQIIQDVDFVPRIKNQMGFFMELPAYKLDEHLVPQEIRFHQLDGVLFEDEHLGISEALIYPPDSVDRFAPLAAPKLKRHAAFQPALLPTEADFKNHLRAWRPDFFRESSPAFMARVTCLVDFHTRLQRCKGLRDSERSITRLRTAYGMFAGLTVDDDLPEAYRIVEYYLTQAGEASQPLILDVWRQMEKERTPSPG